MAHARVPFVHVDGRAFLDAMYLEALLRDWAAEVRERDTVVSTDEVARSIERCAEQVGHCPTPELVNIPRLQREVRRRGGGR